MSDEERAKVGTCYKRDGQSAAIALGHRLVSGELRQQRMHRWQRFVNEHPDAVLYCLRGGLRSATVQQWLADCACILPRVEGGYKAMRRTLIETLQRTAMKLPLVSISGRTGSGKTLLLNQLPHSIDLEAMAKHRGSSFGATLESQPSNIDFENNLSIELLRIEAVSPDRVFIEDEGKMIGRVCLPQILRERLPNVPTVILQTSLTERVALTRDTYIDVLLKRYSYEFGEELGLQKFCEHHRHALQRIRKRLGGMLFRRVLEQFDSSLRNYLTTGSFAFFNEYVETLLTHYYDPMYDYQIAQKTRQILFKGRSEDIIAWANRF